MPPLIVIAEDDTAILGLLTEVPEGEGYRVQQATDGAAALARLCAERADPLLIDQQLPRSTGLAVIAELSARVGAVLPIILMSTLIPPVLPVPPVVFLATVRPGIARHAGPHHAARWVPCRRGAGG